MKTKDRILQTALRLFNEQGLPKVTLRTIANEMNISQGNLNYHYKKREDIIEALYFELAERIDTRMTQNQVPEISLKLLFDTSGLVMASLYEYRFLLLDFAQIMRENETIRKHFLELSARREQEFLFLFQGLEKKGLMRPETFQNEYAFLYERIKLMGDFWISSAEIAYPQLNDQVIAHYSRVISLEIYPYLTRKGQAEFRQLFSFPE